MYVDNLITAISCDDETKIIMYADDTVLVSRIKTQKERWKRCKKCLEEQVNGVRTIS